ncbi:MAG: hypothetical protein KAH23_00120 [Kiritimatiellae bacterium]|nr:hypothetical protein [Kiritimatiellia bacterium]
MRPAKVILLLLFSWMIIISAGCATPPRITGRTAYIQILSQNTISIQGKRITRMMVSSKLKAAGATKRTHIEIALSGKASTRAIKSLENSIRKGGFRDISVSAKIRVSDQGIITVGGKRIKLAHVGSKLKAIGATSNTRIVLSFGRTISKKMMNSITSTIIRAGFPRILVAHQMRPTASVGRK